MWWVVLGFVTYMLPSTIRVLRTGKPEGILKQISMVILETLFEANIISTNPKMSSLEVNKIADEYYISAGALSQRDNNILIQSLHRQTSAKKVRFQQSNKSLPLLCEWSRS